MEQPRIYTKVAVDMFWVQFKWTLSFLGIMFVIHIIRIIASFYRDFEVDTYFNAVFVAASIFMFVIGIICINFLQNYVETGVTRRDYFKGTLLASVGISVVLPILTFVVSALAEFIVTFIDVFSFKDPNINSVVLDMEIDTNIFGTIISLVVQTFVVPPYVDPNVSWILAIGVVSLNIFIYYILGWLISAGFYKLGTTFGLGIIVVGICFLILKDALLRISLELPLYGMFEFANVIPNSIAVVTVCLLIVISIWIIYSLLRRVSVKPK